jgi:molybdopterin-guanine dinucleotide biosynthesis protein A
MFERLPGTHAMQRGALILCGGKSSRMGRDKATLPFGPELMLQRVIRLLSDTVDPEHMVVVAAPNQLLPKLPHGVRVARDDAEFQGPLQGLATGLAAIGDQCDALYATACDVPLLVPTFAQQMFDTLGEYQIAVPFDGEHYHPLSAVYRPQVAVHVQNLLAANRMRPVFLFDEVPTRKVHVEELRNVDPHLSTLKNLNHYEDYLSALRVAGLPLPPRET